MDHSSIPHAEPSEQLVGASRSLGNRRRFRRRLAGWFVILLLGWLGGAYLLMPLFWDVDESRHPALNDLPNVTRTANGVPGDPLNAGLIGTKRDLMKSMLTAGWHPANPLTLKSCLKIAEATVLKRPYDEAPVSSLYLFGRKEDLAFEKPVGPDPRKRHHVRFWETAKRDPDGRSVWIGSASFDEKVGLSHRTGQITHHIAPDVDAERDLLFVDLNEAGVLNDQYVVPHFHQTLAGRNGGGDRWRTDGDLYVGVLEPE